jgi:predicted nucleic acid-binding protein
MKHLVADAGVILAWFEPGSPRRAMRDEYEAGGSTVHAPRGLIADALEMLAARGMDADRLGRVATELARLGLELHDPPVDDVARWIARGLPAGRAAYAALAAASELRLVTDDPELRRVAPALTASG